MASPTRCRVIADEIDGSFVKNVLIVVLNYNKKDLLLECLASLCGIEYPNYHVVVFDNASEDGSADAVARNYPELDLYRSDVNLGAIGGRNAAVEYGKTKYNFDYIMFLDDDAEITPKALTHLVEALEEDQAAGIACGKTFVNIADRIIMSAGIRERFFFAVCYDRGAGVVDVGAYDSSCYVDACGAFAFLIRTDLFESLGGFDPKFSPYGFEDVDLCLRARKRGIRTCYAHSAILVHKGTRVGRKPLASYEQNKIRNYLILLARHMTLVQKLCAIVTVPARMVWLFVKFAKNGQWSMIPAQCRGALDYFMRRSWIAPVGKR